MLRRSRSSTITSSATNAKISPDLAQPSSSSRHNLAVSRDKKLFPKITGWPDSETDSSSRSEEFVQPILAKQFVGKTGLKMDSPETEEAIPKVSDI